MKQSESYRSSLKSLDTEENIDLWFYRPVGYAWAKGAKFCGITPNAITIASIFLGVGAGILFYFNNLWINILGMFLLVWANSFDSADGQLARMTHQYSKIGRILDGLSGDLWFASIYLAICMREIHFTPFFHHYPWVMWILIIAAALCHSRQASLADYYRQIHLFFLKGSSGSELTTAEELKRKLQKSEGHASLIERCFERLYLFYTEGQEGMTPCFQKFYKELMLKYPDGDIPQQFRIKFREKSLPLMKYANALTFNWRAITLFVSLLLGIPWLYPVAEITVFNLLMISMHYRHEKLSSVLTEQILQL